MKKLIIALTVAFLTAIPAARADFAAGAQAYDGGDYDTAFAEWSALAHGGDAEAQIAIADLYRFGAGRAPDMVKAAYWFRRAADQGDEIAQLNLGELYMTGQGVTRDLIAAYMWMSLAAGRNRWAAGKRDELAQMLSQEQISRAHAWIRAWRPSKPEG